MTTGHILSHLLHLSTIRHHSNNVTHPIWFSPHNMLLHPGPLSLLYLFLLIPFLLYEQFLNIRPVRVIGERITFLVSNSNANKVPYFLPSCYL